MRLAALSILVALSVTSLAKAETSRFSWSGELRYDPAAPVPGGNLGTLLAAIAGDTAHSGRLPVSGTVVYDLSTQPAAINARSAGWKDAVTEMSVQLGSVRFIADIALIAKNAETSRVGWIALPNGGFCGDADHCDMFGLVPPGWGNQAGTLNDTQHFWVDETGVKNYVGDAFGFMIGRTDGVPEFDPVLQTANHGLVSLDGASLVLFSAPGQQFMSQHELFPIERLIPPGLIGRSELAIFLDAGKVGERVRIEGTVTRVSPLD